MACHAHGDDAITMVLDAWEQLLKEHPRPDHRFASRTRRRDASRISFVRAAELGVTVSIFIDHLHYWGDVLVDDLFGPRIRIRLGRSRFCAGSRATVHLPQNDGPVTPANPLRNMQDAVNQTFAQRPRRRTPGTDPRGRSCARPYGQRRLAAVQRRSHRVHLSPAPTRILLCCRQIPSTSSRPGWPTSRCSPPSWRAGRCTET